MTLTTCCKIWSWRQMGYYFNNVDIIAQFGCQLRNVWSFIKMLLGVKKWELKVLGKTLESLEREVFLSSHGITHQKCKTLKHYCFFFWDCFLFNLISHQMGQSNCNCYISEFLKISLSSSYYKIIPHSFLGCCCSGDQECKYVFCQYSKTKVT